MRLIRPSGALLPLLPELLLPVAASGVAQFSRRLGPALYQGDPTGGVDGGGGSGGGGTEGVGPRGVVSGGVGVCNRGQAVLGATSWYDKRHAYGCSRGHMLSWV